MSEATAGADAPNLVERSLIFLDILRTRPRVAIYGGTKTGKTNVFGALVKDRPVIHTDDWLPPRWAWDDVPGQVIAACRGKEKFLVEGVRCLAAIREGLKVDVVINLTQALEVLDAKRTSFNKARATNLKKFRAEYPEVEVIDV